LAQDVVLAHDHELKRRSRRPCKQLKPNSGTLDILQKYKAPMVPPASSELAAASARPGHPRRRPAMASPILVNWAAGPVQPPPFRFAATDPPILIIYGPDTPPKSPVEMEALAGLPGTESKLLDRGTLGMAEEFADDLKPLIDGFLSAKRPKRAAQDQYGKV
jgi:hypothetical protein